MEEKREAEEMFLVELLCEIFLGIFFASNHPTGMEVSLCEEKPKSRKQLKKASEEVRAKLV